MGIQSEEYWRRILPPEYARKAAGRWVIGDEIGYSHRIIQILGGPGKSGMGIVYICYCECNDDLEEETVAIKTLQNRFHEDRALIERFKWEAETWVKLGKHSNIVEAKRVEIHGGKPYIYLECVVGDRQYGSSLSGWIHNGGLYRNGKPDIPLILDFTIQFCHGMMHAGKKFQEMGNPFVHRDIKPSNIMVTRDRVVKITDFGLVKAFADLDEDISTTTVEDDVNRRLSLSKSGSVCGTPPYMSPEQCRGVKDVDIRSDIYAFGCVLYEMLTRRLVFDGRTIDEFIRHHLKTKPRSPNVQPDLDAVVMKCLEKRPANRYTDFKELEGVLSSIYRKLTGKEVKELDTVPLASRKLNNKGLSLLALGLKEEAVSCFLEALRINPDDDEVHNNLADAYKNQGKLDEAVREYQEVLRLNPDSSRPHKDMGDVYKAQGKSDEAVREYREALGIDPDNFDALKKLGDLYENQGKLDEAVREYREVLKLNPGSGSAHRFLGDVYRTQGKFDEALKEYQQVLRLNPDDRYLHYNLGEVYQAQGKLDEAIREYREELRINPYDEVVLDTLREVYQAQGKPNEAIRLYQEVLRLSPDSSWAHSDIGQAYKHLGKYDEAIKEYREALRIDPNRARLHVAIGDIYKTQGKFDEAVKECQEALSLKPDEGLAYLVLGEVYQAQGKYDEAIKEYREALRIDPNYDWAHYNLGDVYKAQEKLDEAIKEYREAVRITPNYADARYNLASGLEITGKHGEALEQWKRYLALAWKVPEQKERIPEAQQHIKTLESKLQ
jgi:tetratricopeptide (TPR) repeat protein